MPTELRILMLENCAADAVLIDQTLRSGGLVFRSTQVDNEKDFLRELEENPPDLILSDHGLPGFDGFTALVIAQNHCPGTPFIFVTGALEEAVAVEALECGATGYVLKDRLSTQLVPAVQRALHEAGGQGRRRPAGADLEDHLEVSSSLVLICSACEEIRDERGRWWTLQDYLRAHPETPLTQVTCRGVGRAGSWRS